MTDSKPKVFIGSSTGGYDIAEKVKKYLSKVADCYLWKEKDVWQPNESTFENLIRMASYFDFGVFVATSDDLTLTNDAIVIEPRDNVILEMSLFLGAMGRHKSFLLVEKDIKLPTDFKGIYMPTFTKGDEKSIEIACEEYANKIAEYYQFGFLSLYPTTALAIGYYKNFIAGLAESANEALPLEFEGVTFTDYKIKVVLPKDLEGIIKEKASKFYKRHGYVENTLKTRFRNHPAWFHLDTANAPVALIYDMPSTLTGIDTAIELILHKDYVGRTKLQSVIEERELNNFRRVLQMEINKSAYAKDSVEIIDEF